MSGKTKLILKVPDKGPVPSNYWLITCLPVMWKLFSGILSRKILTHLSSNKMLAFEQKGICPGSKGTKDQLLIDKMVGTDCKTRRTNLAVAWIDFQKAYDSVPHSWIIEILCLYKINPLIQYVIKQSMSL